MNHSLSPLFVLKWHLVIKHGNRKSPINGISVGKSSINGISIAMFDCQYVPHKAVVEVSKIADYRRLVAVKHRSQSKSTDGSTSGWRQRSVVVVVIVVAMQL